MKKFVLSLVAALAISPVMADDSVNLAGLGLGGLQPVSEAAGMKVRGMGSASRGMSMGTASLLVLDPNGSAKYTNTVTAFEFSSAESAGTGDYEDGGVTSNAGVSLGWGFDFGTDAEGEVSGFSAGGTGGFFSFSQGGSYPEFNWTIPAFFGGLEP